MKLKSYLLLMITVFLISGCASMRLVHLAGHEELELDRLAGQIRNERVICVGEVHDRLLDHENELTIIKTLHEAGIEFAIGMEMFNYHSQPVLDRWLDGALGWAALKAAYDQNWKLPMGMYTDIFHHAGKEQIPLLALNVPQNIAAKVARSGFSSLTAFERQGLPDTVICDENLPQMVLLRKILAMHGTNKRFDFFCEAQTLRDRTMAQGIIRFLREHPAKKVVMLAGIGHCAKQGIPAQILELSGLETMVILPSVADQALGRTISVSDADYIIVD